MFEILITQFLELRLIKEEKNNYKRIKDLKIKKYFPDERDIQIIYYIFQVQYNKDWHRS